MTTTIEQLHTCFLDTTGVVTDTRKIRPGQMFFALRGPHFNGNLYAREALDKGARWAVVDDAAMQLDPGMLLVDNCLEALQQLARYHRSRFSIPVLAITGSNGKTTTKELIHAVLSTAYNTCTTEGNLNNHIGIPLTLLRITAQTEIAVVEMGANHQQEIADYCTYTLPTHGLITNCGKAHLEGFGGVEGVRKGKGELFDYLALHQGIAFAAADFDYFHQMAAKLPRVRWYGTTGGQVQGKIIESAPFLSCEIISGFPEPARISTKLVGKYNIYNVLAAVAVGLEFGVPPEKMAAAIENYTPSNSRSQFMESGGNHIIMDAYNANPTSMAAAIENFAGLPVTNKILFLGAMMELGEESLAEHRQLIELIGRFTWKEVVLVGGDFGKTAHPYRYFPTADLAAQWWQSLNSKGNYLLVKGSRSIQMEKVTQPATDIK